MRSDVRSRLQTVIAKLTRLKEICAAALVRRDGLVIAHELPPGTEARRLSAMTAAIVGTAEMAAECLDHGQFERCVITTGAGDILSKGAGSEAILVVLASPRSNLGLVLMAVETVAEEAGRMISGGGVSVEA